MRKDTMRSRGERSAADGQRVQRASRRAPTARCPRPARACSTSCPSRWLDQPPRRRARPAARRAASRRSSRPSSTRSPPSSRRTPSARASFAKATSSRPALLRATRRRQASARGRRRAAPACGPDPHLPGPGATSMSSRPRQRRGLHAAPGFGRPRARSGRRRPPCTWSSARRRCSAARSRTRAQRPARSRGAQRSRAARSSSA